MTISNKATAIGLVAPFGSGSTTAAAYLESDRGYRHLHLSSPIRDRWNTDHAGTSPSRHELQAIGNLMREESADPGCLAQQLIQTLEADTAVHTAIVFDGLRNIGEIETLRDRFGRRFYLIAIDCPTSQRWDRISHSQYESLGKAISDFNDDDQRDRDEEYVYGQQVQPCVDQADVFITNDNDVTLSTLRKNVVGYVEVVTGEAPRFPAAHEILMNLGYSAAHGSKCLKRQVGAILVAAEPMVMGEIVGQGFNDNPVGTPSCVDEPSYGADPAAGKLGSCFRDMVRHRSFVQLVERGAHCPKCGDVIVGPMSAVPPWKCPACGANLEDFFWPERAMSLCTAVHAEVAALLTAGTRAKGSTLYTTTFPCFQCAEKIAHAGVKYVVYTEPYPDVRAAGRLDIAGIEVVRFQGVRSGRFDEIFSRARPYVGQQLAVIAKAKPTI